ncbi:MAG TPA: YfiR family protein [Oxalicibacterium sp.]|nr:YfiR family protein [Oxalicibacterium sp.]
MPPLFHRLHIWQRAASARLLALLFLLFSVLWSATLVHAASDRVASEEAVKAASLYKFLNYIEWPPESFASADTPYVIGVADASGVADALSDIVAQRRVNNRQIVIKRLRSDDNATGIHLLFIGKSEKSRQAAWIKSVQRQPVLIVTEMDNALAQGSMINFTLVDHRVRFEVNLASLDQSRLKINTRMLAVAVAVIKDSPQ